MLNPKRQERPMRDSGWPKAPATHVSGAKDTRDGRVINELVNVMHDRGTGPHLWKSICGVAEQTSAKAFSSHERSSP